MPTFSQWDEAYRTGEYQQLWGMPHPSQELVSFAAAYGSTAGKVAIDVGCGAGTEAIFLVQCGFTTYGFDQSVEALKIATQRAKDLGLNITFQEANILHVPLADQTVDLINDRGCFHVIPDDIRPDYAKEMARLLKPGGKIFIRGCRDTSNERFHAITDEAIKTYFSDAFDATPVYPLEMNDGTPSLLHGGLVILTKRK
ncbi:class I SAM-dependent methyltransferase [Shimazuella sp. AN120528]|uniref:class I SAM-dependent methyltransferase n=1 Tax=Shimazuella soli TaxID=1892854 RepID=UPI001F0D7F50|nr:class I SAM-dependent methyltransferase [Shimazuella soli]MCH5586109.1 class I SAM-dependent methyltransferase [Shimazuella soli]